MFLRLDRSPAAAFICCMAVLLITVSCSDDPVTPEPAPAPVPTDLEITVVDQTITISWNPKLQVNKLYVEGLIPGHSPSVLVWFIADENGLTPPITYGDLPPGAQALRPALSHWNAAPYRATIIRSDGYDDDILATAARSPQASAGSDPVVYAPELMRITPPGVTPEVWEYSGRVATVPSSGWSSSEDIEALLEVQKALVRDLIRDEQGVQRLIEYEDYRNAREPGGDPNFGFMWDYVPPVP